MDELINKEKFKQQVAKQIKEGNDLLSRQINSKAESSKYDEELWKWDSFNRDVLKLGFTNPSNSYYQKYDTMMPSAKTLNQAMKPIKTYKSVVEATKNEISDRLRILKQIENSIELMAQKEKPKPKSNFSAKNLVYPLIAGLIILFLFTPLKDAIFGNEKANVIQDVESNAGDMVAGDKVVNNYNGSENKIEDKNQFKIVAFTNERDSFSITVMNNSQNAKYISQLTLHLENRKQLDFVATTLNALPFQNEKIIVLILKEADTYEFYPEIYIEPKKAEVLNFILHRPDEYYGYEIMEATFDILLDDGNDYQTERIKDFIGHHELFLSNNKEDLIRMREIVLHNKPIIEDAKDSKLLKSDRLARFLVNYENELKEEGLDGL